MCKATHKESIKYMDMRYRKRAINLRIDKNNPAKIGLFCEIEIASFSDFYARYNYYYFSFAIRIYSNDLYRVQTVFSIWNLGTFQGYLF